MTVPPPATDPYLSIVFTGRNDNYGADFLGRFLRTLAFNHAQLSARGLPHEFVLVEWAPPADRPLLSDIVSKELPALDPTTVRTVVVAPEYQDALSLNPRLAYLEYVAKNVGVRRAAAPFVLSTNCDIYLGRVVLDALGRRDLAQGTLYRAARYDLKLGLDESRVDWDLLEDPRNLATPPKAIRPPLYGPGTGDFILMDRSTWHELRGFNEIYRVGRAGIDRNLIVKAHSSGVPIRDIGGPVYHVNHPGSFRLTGQQAGASPPPSRPRTVSPRDAVYRNPSGWGLGDAPAVSDGPRRTRLTFDWAAVPPLVDLRGLSLPGARGGDVVDADAADPLDESEPDGARTG